MKHLTFSSLSLAIFAALSLSAQASTYENISDANGPVSIVGDPSIEIGSETADKGIELSKSNSETSVIDTALNGNIDITANRYGINILTSPDIKAVIGSKNTNEINIQSSMQGIGIVNSGYGATRPSLTLNGKHIKINVIGAKDSAAQVRGVSVQEANLNLGSEATETIAISGITNSDKQGYGLYISGQSTFNVNVRANQLIDISSNYIALSNTQKGNVNLGSDTTKELFIHEENGLKAIENGSNTTYNFTNLMKLNAQNISISGSQFGIDNFGNLDIGSEGTQAISIAASGDNSKAISSEVAGNIHIQGETVNIKGTDNAIWAKDSDIEILGRNISLSSQTSDVVSIGNGGNVTIGDANTDTINITGDLSKGYFGLFMVNNQDGDENTDDLTASLHAKNIVIDVGNGSGIQTQNNTQSETRPADATQLNISAENTIIKAATGILAFSNSAVNIEGNLTINATEAAIDTRGNSLVNINENGEGTVKIIGDIVFETPGDEHQSGNIIDSNVDLNLTGEDSYWTGTVYKYYPEANKDTEEFTKVDGLNITLSEGAQWNATVNDETAPEGGLLENQAINQLTVDAGVINAAESNQTVSVDQLTVTEKGGTFNAPTEQAKDGHLTSSTLAVKTVDATKDSRFTVNYTGITSDQINENNARDLNAVSLENVQVTETAAEGDIKGAWSRENGEGAGAYQENTKLLSFRGVNAASLVAWRDEVAYTNQRMEYLRDNSHAFGAWAQVYGGESSYDDATVDLTTTTVQVGADATIGDWIAGAAFSYSKGDADMANGSADTDSYTLSLYTARNFDSGFYVNGLARYGRLSTDATAGNMTASYDNNAFSIGGNVGYRFNFAQQAFVEPNFGLQYAYVMGDDYTATNGVKVEQDDFDALIASLGARVGFNFVEDAGKIYARASVNHDFLGEVDGTASKAGLADSMYVDLGGTWVTYGIGTQFNFTENLSVWGNLDRTTGGEVSTHYMMNAGLRYVF